MVDWSTYGVITEEKHKDILDSRRDLCNNCEHKKIDICMLCSCFLPAKHRLALARCPIGKWEYIEPSTLGQ